MGYRILALVFICIIMPISVQANILLVLGDSLSAAYGMPVDKGWVALLEQRIIRQNLGYKVINASMSGETTLGAKTRLDKLLTNFRPQLVIVELGGNDGLRGFSLTEIRQNLLDIVDAIKQAGSKVLLVPMQLPPNYGVAYNERFMSIYRTVADKKDISLSAFILKDIAQHHELMQDDGIHPVQAAQLKMLDNIWSSLQTLIIK